MKAKKTDSGNYRIQIKYKDSTGKARVKQFTAPTKLEAEQMALDFKLGKIKKEPSRLTFGQAMTEYVDSRCNVLSPSTIREYRRTIDREPQYIKDLYVDEIDNIMMQNEFNKRATKLSPKSLRNIRGFYASILNVYRPNFKLKVTLSPKVKVETYMPSVEDVQRLINLSEGALRKAVILAALGSLRRSEISALLTSDIKGNVITIDKAMVEDVNKKWVIKPPKTLAGNRKITLPQKAVEILLKDCQGKSLVGLNPNQITRQFEKLVRNNFHFTFRFHDLRHYQAAVLHSMGVPDLYIMKRGGWEDKKTLDKVYEYTFDKKVAKVNDKIADAFEPFFGKR